MAKRWNLKTKLTLEVIILCSFILPVIVFSLITVNRIQNRFNDLLEMDAPRQFILLLMKGKLFELEASVLSFSQDYTSTIDVNQRKALLQQMTDKLGKQKSEISDLLEQYYSHVASDDRNPPFSREQLQTYLNQFKIDGEQYNANQELSWPIDKINIQTEEFEQLLDNNFKFELNALEREKQETAELIQWFKITVIIIGLLMYVFALSIGFFFINHFITRIRHLRNGAAAMVEGTQKAITQPEKDELGDLAKSLNKMLRQLLHSNRALEENVQKTKNILNTVSDSIVTIDGRGLIQTVNAATCTIFGYSEEELTGLPISKLCYPFALKEVLGHPVLPGNHQKLHELTGIRKNAEEFPMELAFSTLKEQDSMRAVCAFRDIRARKEMEAKIRYQATYDSLTGLPNRLLLHDRLQQGIAQAKRNNSIVAVIFLDLDRFKIINDSLGHEAGDELLKIASNRLKKIIRGSDTVARQGGDEFVIVLNSLSKEEMAVSIIKNILEEIAKPFKIENRKLSITCSAGISFFPKNGTDSQTLLKNADAAMYRSKEMGRNTFQFYEKAMNERTLVRLEMENELRNAITNHEIDIYYQPLMDVQKGKLLGAEALVRWVHPRLGIIPPLQFIPMAEETGLIIPIGAWILKEACRNCAEWLKQDFPIHYVSVNISGNQFKYGDIVQTVKSALEESGLNPSHLELELTESILIEDTENSLQKIKQLKEIGVSLAIDDFGTGYSSLSYIRRFPIDKIKIDHSFIGDLEVNKSSSELAETIISLAKNLNLSVLAEGVEKKAQLDFLKQHHCNQAQGFFFSEPLPEKDFEQWMKKISQEKE
ncbi:EAL domain-containing protein [Legionella jordanis]|uniref:cyclic-guanylate-specific phosphodiesterase n=1 Tax=Legionella jordanis TaxID=456 RepID=A0A0W0VGD2_9GAMM|nr:EAL domain-containing protein [Legionella jordanis]KTD19212.1 regulatory protein (GGDEF and EAL domains) [Legionella jordanis]RMW99851.1 EAL domain-containing protein [Legionella jordanis]VEH12902.1 regulatory protein (GGDEF and EAL domains) [Legionella jordanis]